MNKLLAVFALVLADAVIAPTASAQQERTDRETSSLARVSVAQAMYASTATTAAMERAADARISEQRRQIEAMQARLETIGGSNAALETEIARAQERFIEELAARDRAYAQEIAVFRNALTNIASTPAGARALRLFNSGDELGALAILDDVRDANDRARAARLAAEAQAQNRRIALLWLEARARAHLGAQSAELGPFVSDAQTPADDEADNMVLAGNLEGARQRLETSLAAREGSLERQPEDATLRLDIANLHDRAGDVAAAQGDVAAAIGHYVAGLAIRRALVVVEPEGALLHRGIAVSLYKLARLPGSGVTWTDVARQFEIMVTLGLLAERDAWALTEFRRRANMEGAARAP